MNATMKPFSDRRALSNSSSVLDAAAWLSRVFGNPAAATCNLLAI